MSQHRYVVFLPNKLDIENWKLKNEVPLLVGTILLRGIEFIVERKKLEEEDEKISKHICDDCLRALRTLKRKPEIENCANGNQEMTTK